MVGTIYSKFFWQDFQGDDELRLCSLGAQGLWMRMLCMAARANPVGHVLVGGRNPTPDDIRRVTGCVETDEQIEAYRRELIDTRTCDVTPSGVLVSRRLVRDARRRSISTKGGLARQAQRIAPPEKRTTGTSHIVQPTVPATINHQPESINHQPSVGVNGRKMAKVIEALGFDPTASGRLWKWIDSLLELEKAGFDLDLDIVPAIEECRKTGIKRDISSLAYFRRPIEAMRQSRQMAEESRKLRAAAMEAALQTVSAADWERALQRYMRDGVWKAPAIGPSPVCRGCVCPPELLEVARARWEEQGRHPREDLLDDGAPWKPGCAAFPEPLPFWSDNVVAMPRRTAP